MYMLVQYVRAELLDNGKELTIDAPPTLLMVKAHLDRGRSLRPLTPFAGVFQYS
jgi:hypothetical protein